MHETAYKYKYDLKRCKNASNESRFTAQLPEVQFQIVILSNQQLHALQGIAAIQMYV